jgi:hypothetical protein
MMINTLKEYFVDILEAITVKVDNVDTAILANRVYTYPEEDVEFPCGFVFLDRVHFEWHSIKTSQLDYTFKLQIRYSVDGNGSLDVVDNNLMDIVDAIFTKLGSDRRAGNNAFRLEANGGDMGWLDEAHSVRYADIIVEVMNVQRDVS